MNKNSDVGEQKNIRKKNFINCLGVLTNLQYLKLHCAKIIIRQFFIILKT